MKKTFTIKAVLAKSTEPDVYPVAMLVGDESYFLGEDIYIPADEIATAAHSMEGQPVNLDHSHALADEVGYMRNVKMDGKTLRGEMVLNPETAKYAIAKGFIENRFKAGKTPETSVGVYMEVHGEAAKDSREKRLTARNLAFDHNALVTRGACSPETGCGVGLCRHAHDESGNDIMSKKDLNMDEPEADPTAETTADPAPEVDADAAPEADPAQGADADAEVDTKPECSCGKGEALASAREELEAIKTLARDAMRPEAEKLGLEVADDECVKTLAARLKDARAVARNLAAHGGKPPARAGGARRHTASAERKAPPSEWDEAERLLSAGGYKPRNFRP